MSGGRSGLRSLGKIGLLLIVLFTVSFTLATVLGLTDEAAARQWLDRWANDRAVIAPLVVGLLAADLILPVPGSVVMTAAGWMLGPIWGALANFVGAMAGAMAGFALCRRYGQAAFERYVGADEAAKVANRTDQVGGWFIVSSRAVPMMTETVSCLAGLTRMSARKFAALSAIGTAPISCVYAVAGAGAASAAAPELAVWAALGLPALALLIWTLVATNPSSQQP
ncbi:MAG: VTT domain-containing protein [Myxococcales bacterium]|nr:VTT domain-containing protein [Myxococcales bacterium]